MACSCSKLTVPRNADGQAFPLITTEYGLLNPERTSPCCDETDSCASAGGMVPANFMDSCCGNENVTLLGRVGDKLTRFTQSGFIQLKKGKAFVVQSLSIKLSSLYHRRYHSQGKGLPVLGVPLDSHYDVVADDVGEVFAQKGLDTEDSLRMWDKDLERFTTKAVSEIPKTHKGLLQYENELELVGFIPIPANGSSTDVRELSVLSGEGIIVFEKQPTIASDCLCEGCQPVEAEASVAKFLPNPTGDGVFTLKYSVADGHFWDED